MIHTARSEVNQNHFVIDLCHFRISGVLDQRIKFTPDCVKFNCLQNTLGFTDLELATAPHEKQRTSVLTRFVQFGRRQNEINS